MNLLNWIGICLASGIYGAANYWLVVVNKMPHRSVFLVAGCLIASIALFYRPPNLKLRKE